MSEKIADVIKETENNKADRQEQYFFRTDQLTVGYDGKPLIREINIQLKKGEILTLIGPNGAGKSTILKSITRQLATISGTVYLDKEKMAKMTNKEVSQKLAVVLTERMRPELMTCEDIVATGRYPYTGTLGILSAEDKTKVKKSMETVHAWDLKDRDFTAISDGQRQRILLARAICQEPEIIVLDEPTSFLDIRHKLELLTILKQMVLDHLNKLVLAGEPSAVIAFPFQDAPEALHRAVINAMRHAGHTLRHARLHKLVVEGTVGVLKPSVAVEQRMRVRIGLRSLVEGFENQWVIVVFTERVGHNAPVAEV